MTLSRECVCVKGNVVAGSIVLKAWTHANATCAGVTPLRVAMAFTASTSFKFVGNVSG